MPDLLIKCTQAHSGSQLAFSLKTHHVLMHESLIASHLELLFPSVAILLFQRQVSDWFVVTTLRYSKHTRSLFLLHVKAQCRRS
jgi:hypothetical protein